MSQTIEIQVCDMHDHALVKCTTTDFVVDGISIIGLKGTCRACGFDVNISYKRIKKTKDIQAVIELSVNDIIVSTQTKLVMRTR